MRIATALVALSLLPLSTVAGQTAGDSTMQFGSATVTLGMSEETVRARLEAQFTLHSQGSGAAGTSYALVSKSGPPFNATGSLFFVDGALATVFRSWDTDNQEAGVATVEAIYRALSTVTSTIPVPGDAPHRLCDCAVELGSTMSPGGEVRAIMISNGVRTISISVIQIESPPPGMARASVTITEQLSRER